MIRNLVSPLAPDDCGAAANAGGRWMAPVIFVLAVVIASDVRAHNPDTSYARFTIARDHFSAKLIYDVTSLVRIVSGIDADGDRRLTRAEFDAATPAIVDFLQKSIPVEIDGKRTNLGTLASVQWPPDAGDAIAEKDYHAATSLIAFTFEKSSANPPLDVWLKFDFFETLGLRHTVLGAYAHEGDESEVLFTAFEPDYFYETEYVAPPEPTPTATPSTTAADDDGTRADAPQARSESHHRRSSNESVWSRMKRFFVEGFNHIFEGHDHILFLLSLIIVSRLGEIVKVVTSFTVAHSITLALATLGWVEIPSRIVESAIAATIVFTAVENFWISQEVSRWKLTFSFGLIHGFGFAGILRGLNLQTEGYVRSLLAFNLGVEAGQLVIVAALAIPTALLARWKHGRAVQLALSALIALCGLGWFLDRAFGLNLMPF